jgi:hypothetical protein
VSHLLGSVISLICYYSVETGEGTPYDGPWVKDVLPDEVINTYEGWEPDLGLLLKVTRCLCINKLAYTNSIYIN